MNEMIQLPCVRERFCRRERQSVPAARKFAHEVLVDWGLGRIQDDVLLCVSELATNALVHGVPPGRGYLLRLWRYEDALRVEVHDSGDGSPRLREPDGESGRGLMLVAAVADKWGVGERVPGKVAWCEFEVGGPRP
ncbi:MULTISPECIES: ATP-binding protein [unclassified Streptomyces]|uniref:ATP-binding protein n=1 Tax=unclassified Streptomyces TaxID=2593676 RepID=UPI0021C83FE1|nr:ATP-binding protein [Streptomyces sp. FIT100]UUN28456.1 ATP-binding protein [Streptomyces sp. FIT100]